MRRRKLTHRYLHRVPTVNGTMSPEQRALVKAKGCRGWSFDAPKADLAIKTLIADHGTTTEFIEDMLRLRRRAGERLDEARAFERQRERVFEAAQSELHQFERNVGKITDPRRLERLEVLIEEREQAVEQARQAWLLTRSARAQTSEITNDIRDRVDFTKQVLAVWDSALLDDRRTVID
jgi:hypothetical protein